MFNFLKKDAPRENGLKLANQAKIEIVLEDGRISCFLIFLDLKTDTAIKNLKHKKAYSSFIKTIENRIENKEYEDPRSEIMEGLLFDSSKEDNISNIKRAVFSTNIQPIFNWQPQKR